MRGIPLFNFPAFDEARDFLTKIGHIVISPADHDRTMGYIIEDVDSMGTTVSIETSPTFDIEKIMRWDLTQVASCDGIVLLPGWEHSSGTAAELNVARACGLRIFELKPIGPYPLCLFDQQPAMIVGMSGYAQSGKDTTGAVLVTEFGFERISFATPLYDMLYALNPWAWWTAPHGETGWWSVQLIVDTFGWEYAKANSDVRALLQRLGTEAGREILGDDIWVKTAMSKVKPGGRYVFTDVRFPNEAKAIKDAGGQLWRVTRRGSNPVNAHPSETGLDDWEFDLKIHNQGVDLLAFQELVRTHAERLPS